MRILPVLIVLVSVSLTTLHGQSSMPWPPNVPKIDKKPMLLRKTDPVYPDSAMRNGITGEVYVNVQVQTDGTPGKVTIVATDDSLLNEPALSAAKEFLFTPAISEDEPVTDWVTLLFSYKQVFDDSHQFHLAAVSMDELSKEIVERQHPPKVIRKVTPQYPRIAWEAGLEGIVVLKMHVTVAGVVDSITIMKSNNRLFSEACLEAAKGFLFEPASIGKKRIPVWVAYPFRFKARKGIIMGD